MAHERGDEVVVDGRQAILLLLFLLLLLLLLLPVLTSGDHLALARGRDGNLCATARMHACMHCGCIALPWLVRAWDCMCACIHTVHCNAGTDMEGWSSLGCSAANEWSKHNNGDGMSYCT